MIVRLGIADIGLRLKLIADSIPDIQIFATGSSSFDLANRVNVCSSFIEILALH